MKVSVKKIGTPENLGVMDSVPFDVFDVGGREVACHQGEIVRVGEESIPRGTDVGSVSATVRPYYIALLNALSAVGHYAVGDTWDVSSEAITT